MDGLLNDPGNWTAFGLLVIVVGLLMVGKLVPEGAVKEVRSSYERYIARLEADLRDERARSERFAETNAKAIEIIRVSALERERR